MSDELPSEDDCRAKKVTPWEGKEDAVVVSLATFFPEGDPVSAMIKWDGCINVNGVYQGESSGSLCCLHLCEAADLIRFAADIMDVQVDRWSDNGYCTNKKYLGEMIERLKAIHERMSE